MRARAVRTRRETGTGDQAERVLWSIVDGQALPGSRRRAAALVGSREDTRAALSAYTALDDRLRAWASPEVIPVDRAEEPGCSPMRVPLLSRIARKPLQAMVLPSAALGLALFMAAWRFRLDSWYTAVASLVARVRGL